ncbi:hypothetical protein OHA84_37425 (plasmid) [Streptomyces sp. NBC_00513]|uniref:hypothetical protein n=1 Tax=unclassified Streptomyces TaxID=2593676 RepID=UPI0022535766|nr:hypothetical protein [Streptomyces sp. NBC_00424]MCX5078868.1 hypothetical protein [Streptomyces sp. NBC_00424]WUD46212.1 hypothetical protein OHA84_37425 [Streptomyces sp. NBC_00513]
MTTRITFDLPGASGGSQTVDLPDDIALALYDGLTNSRAVIDPKAEDFDELIASTSLLSRLITHLTLSRERHIAAADATSPNANRRAIGIAAAMQPSQLGVVLERNGRPRSRRA